MDAKERGLNLTKSALQMSDPLSDAFIEVGRLVHEQFVSRVWPDLDSAIMEVGDDDGPVTPDDLFDELQYRLQEVLRLSWNGWGRSVSLLDLGTGYLYSCVPPNLDDIPRVWEVTAEFGPDSDWLTAADRILWSWLAGDVDTDPPDSLRVEPPLTVERVRGVFWDILEKRIERLTNFTWETVAERLSSGDKEQQMPIRTVEERAALLKIYVDTISPRTARS